MKVARVAFVLVSVGLLAVAAAGQPAAPVGVVGTITTLNTDGSAVSQCDLRVDRVEGSGKGLDAGMILKVSWHREQSPSRMVLGPGDLIGVTLGQPSGEGGTLPVEGAVAFLGRGEFLNPGKNPNLDLGSPQAKVLVKMLAPLSADCHLHTADLLQGIAVKDPGHVRVQIYDAATPPGREEMRRERLTCATVLVNNRYEFTLQTPEGERKVQLWHKPNTPTSSYNSEDALAVVQQEIARLYPVPPAQAKQG